MALMAFELAWVDDRAATTSLAVNLALAPVQVPGTAGQKRTIEGVAFRLSHGEERALSRGAFCLTEPLPYVDVETGAGPRCNATSSHILLKTKFVGISSRDERAFNTSLRGIMTRKILALGLFAPKVHDTVQPRGIEGVVAAARASFPDAADEIVTIRSLSNFDADFTALTDELTEEQANGPFRGVASGFFVQEALEGGHGITDIHYDLTGVRTVREPTHAGSELRSLIAHVLAFHPRKVNIHFNSSNGLTTFGKESTEFQGAPLPRWLVGHFPQSMSETAE